ncbi:MAG TPA: glycosyltransferase family 39 protein, partial [Candidatus Omnitrophota bacterium]|nr:glycosyltransferase family 39 protein [Candidatus Omnitrophota bacterium]
MGESLWLDELFNTSWFMRDWFEAILHSLRREYLPAYYLLTYGWIGLFGESEISLRMPSLLEGLISIYLAYRIAEMKLGIKPALILALLLAISPTHIWYSSESRPYQLCSMLLLLSLFSFWKLSDRSKASIWDWVFFFSTFLATFTMLYMPLFTVIFLLSSLLSRAPGRNRSLITCMIILFSLVAFILIKAQISPFPHQYDYLRWFNFIELWMLFF